jgi:GAF domain-containing protein
MPTSEPAQSLSAALREVVGVLQRVSGADMVSLFLYDEPNRRYYAPVAAGQDEASLLDSLSDMSGQLAQYLDDLEHGKVPEELAVQQYGSTVWLTVSRKPLVAADAAAVIGSTFVRRQGVKSTIGLPLIADGRLLGLVYLNYVKHSRDPSDAELADLESMCAEAARKVMGALESAQRAALAGLARLTGLTGGPATDDASLRRTVSIALSELLLAADLDSAIVYALAERSQSLGLVTAHAPAAVATSIDVGGANAETAIRRALAPSGLELVTAIPLGPSETPIGYLAVLDRDPLAAARLPPPVEELLTAAARLVGGTLAARRLIDDLQRSSRLLGALARMTNAMIRPGSSQQDVIDAVVGHLTDADVPEFDFHFATVYLLVDVPGGAPAVKAAAGAARVESIDTARSSSGRNDGRKRRAVPRWALEGERLLAPTDVLAYVASRRLPVLVGSIYPGDTIIAGSVPVPLTWMEVRAVRSDGEVVATVPVGLVGDDADGSTSAPFTLDGDIFQGSGHGELIRIFVPFAMAAEGLSDGVLEVGYHRAFERRPDWNQVQALEAAAAQVAIALEAARLYEETRRRSEELELSADVSRAIASSIDLDQTLRLVAGNLARLVDASLCQIALYEEGGAAWYGAAASDQEEEWRRQRRERPEKSFLFDVLDRGEPIVIDEAAGSELVDFRYVEAFGVRSLMAVPLFADGQAIGAAVIAERGRARIYTARERDLTTGLALQAAVAIKNARLHALAEEERHIQKDFVLIGLGQWGQKAYQHLQTLKQFFNFRVHVVERDVPGARERLAERERVVRANSDAFYWDSVESPARTQLRRQLEPSCYVITYVATPAATHLPTVAAYYDLSDVILIEKPLGASPEAYREFLDQAPGGVEIVAADHYYFKLEVRLLQALLEEERTLRDFLDSVEEITIEILEEQPLTGTAADIGVIADLVPHAFAIASLFTPIDRIDLDLKSPLMVGRHESLAGSRESYARLSGSFRFKSKTVRLVVEVGKGVENAKWIRLTGDRRVRGRSPFYKFDFGNGEAIDGTQTTVRAATRRIREPGIPDNAHLTMLRHVIEKRRPAVGILSIREAIRANQRLRELEAMAAELLARGEYTEYALGNRPALGGPPQAPDVASAITADRVR